MDVNRDKCTEKTRTRTVFISVTVPDVASWSGVAHTAFADARALVALAHVRAREKIVRGVA